MGAQQFPGLNYSQLNFDGRFSGPTAPPEVVISGTVTVRYKLLR